MPMDYRQAYNFSGEPVLVVYTPSVGEIDGLPSLVSRKQSVFHFVYGQSLKFPLRSSLVYGQFLRKPKLHPPKIGIRTPLEGHRQCLYWRVSSHSHGDWRQIIQLDISKKFLEIGLLPYKCAG